MKKRRVWLRALCPSLSPALPLTIVVPDHVALAVVVSTSKAERRRFKGSRRHIIRIISALPAEPGTAQYRSLFDEFNDENDQQN
jgi:hypothetical protein